MLVSGSSQSTFCLPVYVIGWFELVSHFSLISISAESVARVSETLLWDIWNVFSWEPVKDISNKVYLASLLRWIYKRISDRFNVILTKFEKIWLKATKPRYKWFAYISFQLSWITKLNNLRALNLRYQDYMKCFWNDVLILSSFDV